jgi:hypothetical protein
MKLSHSMLNRVGAEHETRFKAGSHTNSRNKNPGL